jgi:hypothetical protein
LSANLSVRASARMSLGQIVVAAYFIVILALVVHFVSYLRYALAAVWFPFQLDYGEGIVWQQALLIPGERMYGDITRFPFIVFHYPPFYHLVVRAFAWINGDMLIAGRAVSLISTLLTGVLVAAVSYDIAGRHAGRTAGMIGSAIAGLTVFCYWPVICWSPLMRVDMLAVMLGLLGLWLAGRSFQYPWLLNIAVLVFVLGVYTKQTSISAPLAVLCVGLLTDRRRTITAFGLGLFVGLTALLVLTWMTDGGFLRHLLFYNLNRFSLRAVVAPLVAEAAQTVFLVAAFGGLAAGWTGSMNGISPRSPALLARHLSQHAPARLMAILTLYFIFATCMLVTLGKSGATLNYLIEWMCLWSVLIGVLVTSALGRLFAEEARAADKSATWPRAILAQLIPMVLLLQILLMPSGRGYYGSDPSEAGQLDALVARIKDARQPVLSDDMVLLLKAGKPVPWEPAIFVELASTGRWDERLITDMIAAQAFAFIVTTGHADQEAYDGRFTPTVDRTILEAYPRTEEQAGRTLHFPPE